MTIANVIRAENNVLRIVAGVPSILTVDPADAAAEGSPKYTSAVHRMTAWFEGRLMTARSRDGGPTLHWDIRRWVSASDGWVDTATPVSPLLQPPAGGLDRALPGLISFGDRIYMFYNREGQNTAGVSETHHMNWASWEPDPETSGASDGGSILSRTYSKSAGVEDHSHILDLIEYFGDVFVATPVQVMNMTLPDGNLNFIDAGQNFDDQTTKAFSKFTPTGVDLALLYMLEADGKVQRVTPGAVLEQADLTSVAGGTIDPGNTNTDVGYGCKLIAIGTELFAFLNDNTGTVLFKSSNGVDWTEESASLPTVVRNNVHHIKGEVDPSDSGGGDLARMLFVRDGTNAFEVYEFDGTTTGTPATDFTLLPPGGSASGESIMSYTFYDTGAADVEIQESPDLTNLASGEVSQDYIIFNEAGLSASVTVVVEYSIDEGSTWTAATAASGSGLGSETLTGLDAVNSRPENDATRATATYTFVWDFASDVGTGLTPNARLRIRSV